MSSSLVTDMSVFDPSQAERFFNHILLLLVLIVLSFSFVAVFVELPDIPREIKEKIPARFAELILAKPDVKPIAIPEPVVPDPVVENMVEPELTKVEEKKPEVKVPVQQTVAAAQEKAKRSGILAFQDDLNDLRESIDVEKLSQTKMVQRGAGESATLDRSMLTTKKGGRRANVNLVDLSKETGGVALAARETTIVEVSAQDVVGQIGYEHKVRSIDKDSRARSIEEIRRVFDSNKGAIYAIYNRALRNDPSLIGKVVLELIIDPNGNVSECLVVSTELNNDELLAKLIRRIQLFDFGQKDAAVTRISYPVHFLPT